MGFFAWGVSSYVLAETSADSARIDASIYQRVVEENLDLRKEQARIDVEIGTLRRKNASLLLDIQDLEGKRDQLTSLVAQLKTPDELAAQMARLNAEKLVLVREIERLRESFATNAAPVTNAPPVAVTPGVGSDLFLKLERENADLRQEMAKARATGINESAAKEVSQKSEATLKMEVARLESQCKDNVAEIEALRRRGDSFKKALEVQAKKAFESEQTLKKSLENQAKKDEEAEALKKKALETETTLKKLSAEMNTLHKQTTQQQNNVDVIPKLLAAGQKSLLAGHVKEAEKTYLEAYRRDPKNADISYNLGVLYGDYLKDFAEAVKYYRNYLELAPTAADADVVRSWLIDMNAKVKW